MSAPESGLPLGERLSEKELCPDDLLAGQEAAFARDIQRLHRGAARFVKVNCPACEADAPSQPAFEKFGFSFRRCQVCRTIYMSPRPGADLMAEYYANSENYAYWAKYIFPASEASRREKIHRPWLERILDVAARHQVPHGTLVEIGPGFGTFAALATESGRFDRVLAVEPTPEMARACRARGVNVVEKRIEDAASELHGADILVSFEVIEHLYDPAAFVRECARTLAPGRLLILSCPNGLGFDIAMLGSKALAVDAEHVNLFNPGSLGALLERHGFEVLESSTPGRLDAEFVREAALRGEIRLDPFLRSVLLDDWERLGWPFQQFLAAHGLSSHMWIVARRASR